MITSRAVIQKLGGPKAVAETLGEDWKTVHNWTRVGRRIPSTAWLKIVGTKKAVEEKITLEALAALEPNPPSNAEAA